MLKEYQYAMEVSFKASESAKKRYANAEPTHSEGTATKTRTTTITKTKYIYLDESNYLEGENNFFISNLNLNLQKDFKIKSIDKLELNFLNNQG